MVAAQPLHRALAVACVLALPVLAHAQDSTATPTGPSILKGVYTDDQAKKGENTYAKFCVACHEATEHAGTVFEEAWAGRPLYEFFVKIKTTMPDDEPGKLEDQQYTDIVAYMLKLSGYPAGSNVLANDSVQMKAIMVEPRPKPPQLPSLTALPKGPYLPHSAASSHPSALR